MATLTTMWRASDGSLHEHKWGAEEADHVLLLTGAIQSLALSFGDYATSADLARALVAKGYRVYLDQSNDDE